MIVFDQDDIRILRSVIRRVRESLPFGAVPKSAASPPLTEVSWVKLTSTTATAGRYPGTRFDHDTQNTGMDTASETVWMEAPNGEAVDTSTYYPCRFSGILSTDGLAVFVMIAGASAGNRLGWEPVRVYTTSLPSYTRTSNTITATSNGALAAQDGVTLVVGERLLHNRSSGHADNGIWTVTTVGTAGTPYVLDRATDADTSADFKSGYLVSVSEGSYWKNSVFQLATDDPITLNTTAIVFVQVSGAGLLQHANQIVCAAMALTLPSFSQSGSTLTASANGAFPNIDGITVGVANESEFVFYNPSTASAAGGCYYISDPGSGSTPWILKRIPQLDTFAKYIIGQPIYVKGGATYAATAWQSYNLSGTLNSTAIIFVKLSGRTYYSTTANSNQSAFDRLDADFVSLAATGAFNLQGILAPRYVATASGIMLRILNLAGSASITIKHQDAAAASVDRIRTPTAGDVTLAAESMATFIHIGVYWLLVDSN